MRGAVEEQRQKEFEAARRLTRTDVAINGLLREIAAEAQAIAAAELAHRIRIERRFARGQQLNPLQSIARTLAVGIEMPDGLDIAVQHVDAVRIVRAHGE